MPSVSSASTSPSPVVSATVSKKRPSSRKGLRAPLVCLLVAAAAVCIGNAFINENSMRQFYGNQLPLGVDLDAPFLQSLPFRNNTKLNAFSDGRRNGNVTVKRRPLSPKSETSPTEQERSSETDSSYGFFTSKIRQANLTGLQALAERSTVIKEDLGFSNELVTAPSTSKQEQQHGAASNYSRYISSDALENVDPPKENEADDAGDDDSYGKDVEDGNELGIEDEGDGESGGEGGGQEAVGTPEEKDGNFTLINSTFAARPWLKLNRTTAYYGNRTVAPFEKHAGVVIVTKIHGTHQMILLKQSLCLLHYAYNRRPLYDILVFTTMPIPEEVAAEVQELVQPARLSFVVDNRGLHGEIAALSKPRYDNFLKACGVETETNLTWWSRCPGRIAYNWQAEFRAWHIWRHPALAKYTHMMWLDADAFCTEEWKIDPMVAVLENDLVILFDNWPKGGHRGLDVQERIHDAFGHYVCKLRLVDGHLKSKFSNETCKNARLGDVHGFFHITNLEFYRSDAVQKWAETWIGNGFLQRRYDDQSAVTIPAAVLAPDRAWDMRRNKIRLNVYHNFDLDGKKGSRVGGFKKYYRKVVKKQLPDKCPIKATN